ncbi:MAG: RepA replicase [Burkholderiales bacterium]|nr:RepA replicase [Burkholderiales bacterium]
MADDPVSPAASILPFPVLARPDNSRRSASRFRDLFLEAQAITAADAKEAGELGFMSRGVVQAALPYREPSSDLRAWYRSNGEVALLIQPGMEVVRTPLGPGPDAGYRETLQSVGYPYGAIPRLFLAFLVTEAVRTRSPEILLGRSLSDFMDKLGMHDQTGGARGSITRLREQLKRMLSSKFSIQRILTEQDSAFNAQDRATLIAAEKALWWDPKDPSNPTLFESWIKLDAQLFKEMIEHPVPIDLRALRALKTSALALDIYTWLTWRMSFLRRETDIRWEALMQQFGSEAKTKEKFRERFRDALRQVLVVYPCNVIPDAKALKLRPSSTSVRKLLG